MSNPDDIMQFCRSFLLTGRDLPLGSDDDLFAMGLMDSMKIMELLPLLEERYDLTIPPEAITMRNFSSLRALVDLTLSQIRPAT